MGAKVRIIFNDKLKITNYVFFCMQTRLLQSVQTV